MGLISKEQACALLEQFKKIAITPGGHTLPSAYWPDIEYILNQCMYAPPVHMNVVSDPPLTPFGMLADQIMKLEKNVQQLDYNHGVLKQATSHDCNIIYERLNKVSEKVEHLKTRYDILDNWIHELEKQIIALKATTIPSAYLVKEKPHREEI